MNLKVVNTKVADIRVPTSDTLLGSDPFHKKPNYSCVYTSIELSDGTIGHSVCFTSGAGNDWIVYGVNDISKLLENYNFVLIAKVVQRRDFHFLQEPLHYL